MLRIDRLQGGLQPYDASVVQNKGLATRPRNTSHCSAPAIAPTTAPADPATISPPLNSPKSVFVSGKPIVNPRMLALTHHPTLYRGCINKTFHLAAINAQTLHLLS